MAKEFSISQEELIERLEGLRNDFSGAEAYQKAQQSPRTAATAEAIGLVLKGVWLLLHDGADITGQGAKYLGYGLKLLEKSQQLKSQHK
jgi:hypothetical protein